MRLGYSPRIILKVKDSEEYFLDPNNYRNEAFERVAQSQPKWQKKWQKISNDFHGIKIRTLFSMVGADRIQELTQQAKLMDPEYRRANRPNFLTYFVVDCPSPIFPGKIDDLIRAFKSLDGLVQSAYFDPPASEPGVNPDDAMFVDQGYLQSANNGGIDAIAAWNFEPVEGSGEKKGGSGEKQILIDFERGWDLKHPDLPGSIALPIGENISLQFKSIVHGTQTLGVICAVDNIIGCVGITPNLSSIGIASYWGKERPNVLMAAIDRLPLGGVLLLEAQIGDDEEGVASLFDHLPIEKLDAEYDVIRLATALGIIVVAAAGNGIGKDLDTELNEKEDSGAILVAAAVPKQLGVNLVKGVYRPKRSLTSNFGETRVACYAWGDGVMTTTINNNGDQNNPDNPYYTYTKSFDGTSSAAAIVAGAALATQGMIYAKFGVRIDGRRMRDLLHDNGTDSAAKQNIGRMPDLGRIIESLSKPLTLKQYVKPLVDLYLADYEGDNGDPFALPPNEMILFSSPDIIVNGTNLPKVIEIEQGQQYNIELQVSNRGVNKATGVKCRVGLWAEKADGVSKFQWLNNTLTISSIPPEGKKLTSKLNWGSTQTNKLPPGSYYLVGLIYKGDELNGFQTQMEIKKIFVNKPYDYLRTYVSHVNNIAWRQIKVIPPSQPS
ncbi:MAG: S8 family serine peptidase [Acidobacteria bacterium]|nr:S8 family serine peptidase [Acidobacteriota bacterium]MBI3421733.1 S8 family serine peptidase [Acidobacteriota bacterium]